MADKAMVLDFEEFDKKLWELMEKTTPQICADAIFDAGSQLLQDADDEAPQTPWLHGALRRSRKVEKPVIKGTDITVDAGYDMEYAAYQHEGDWPDRSHVIKNWTTDRIPNPGKKFLESKMIKHAGKYMKTIADYLKKKIGD
jgi:hypothetical protein